MTQTTGMPTHAALSRTDMAGGLQSSIRAALHHDDRALRGSPPVAAYAGWQLDLTVLPRGGGAFFSHLEGDRAHCLAEAHEHLAQLRVLRCLKQELLQRVTHLAPHGIVDGPQKDVAPLPPPTTSC